MCNIHSLISTIKYFLWKFVNTLKFATYPLKKVKFQWRSTKQWQVNDHRKKVLLLIFVKYEGNNIEEIRYEQLKTKWQHNNKHSTFDSFLLFNLSIFNREKEDFQVVQNIDFIKKIEILMLLAKFHFLSLWSWFLSWWFSVYALFSPDFYNVHMSKGDGDRSFLLYLYSKHFDSNLTFVSIICHKCHWH